MFDKSNVIIGFTGSIGSGCSFISKRLAKLTRSKYEYFKLSDIIRNELKSEGNHNPTVEDMQIKGNLLRQEKGSEVFAYSLIMELQNSGKKYENIIIDGIKNDAEVEWLRNFQNFYLFSVNADRKIRESRVVGPGKPFKNTHEFKAADTKDEKEKDPNGQQVKKCDTLADITIVNERCFARHETNEMDDFANEILRRYVDLIENRVKGKLSPQTTPSVNEVCMNMAYSMSKRSSCLKRKVGAIIIDTDNVSTADRDSSEAQKIPQVIASGYNEVPAGLRKCIFNEEYQKCYRDHLQEEHARKIKYCPNCGLEVASQMSCPHCGKNYNQHIKFCDNCQKEIKGTYRCSNCDIAVFEEFLPGSKHTPGKLLDLCRALHAEEMALMQLAKSGSNSTGNLVLFATTQPCNLCANKIATAGIKKVVYAEPYDMEEATKVLKNGGVKLERFEGVKSSAYFKLYN